MFLHRKRSKDILEHTRQNCDEVMSSEVCGCVECLAVFRPEEIKEWSEAEDRHDHHKPRERDKTALCPHCGEAAVIGDSSGMRVSPATLETMRAHMRLS